MEKCKISIISILLLAPIYLGVSVAFASDILRYSLCQNNIANAFTYSHKDYHAVGIQLTQHATEAFAKLTKENIGRRLEILFRNKVVVSAAITDDIKSGQIQLKAMSEREANKLLEEILNQSPKRPCGVMHH